MISLHMHRFRNAARHRHKCISRLEAGCRSAATLADLRPGEQAILLRYSSDILPERLTQLQSYGMLPGRTIRVLQDWPVVVVQIEHTELAVENDLARQIYIRLEAIPGL